MECDGCLGHERERVCAEAGCRMGRAVVPRMDVRRAVARELLAFENGHEYSKQCHGQSIKRWGPAI